MAVESVTQPPQPIYTCTCTCTLGEEFGGSIRIYSLFELMYPLSPPSPLGVCVNTLPDTPFALAAPATITCSNYQPNTLECNKHNNNESGPENDSHLAGHWPQSPASQGGVLIGGSDWHTQSLLSQSTDWFTEYTNNNNNIWHSTDNSQPARWLPFPMPLIKFGSTS